MSERLQLPSELPEGFQYTASAGLTEAEALRRKETGDGNRLPENREKPVSEILRDHVFTLFNLLNVSLALLLILAGSYRNMLFMGVVISNILIGTIQEVRAQRTIRNLKLLNTPRTTVLREGRETVCNPEETVRGDLVVLRAGDQVIADAVVTEGQGAAMEALLTGEKDAVAKTPGSWLYSGSYISEGKVTAQLVYVAEESYVSRLTQEARQIARPESRLMLELKRLIKWVSAALVPLGILLFLEQTLISGRTWSEAVPPTVAAMIGMIPEGLILLTSIAMAAGVVKLGRKKALVQELAGIETLARVNVLCLDKTGTLTTGRMTPEATEPLQGSAQETAAALNRFLGAAEDRSGTLDALRRNAEPGSEKAKELFPFSSENKKSAAVFEDGTALILGAPEFVLGEAFRHGYRKKAEQWTARGRRVLLLAEGKPGNAGEFPKVTRPLGFLILREEIRAEAPETLRYFREQGVAVKIISGDDPETVARIAREAGVENWDSWVNAGELKDREALAEASEKYTVFGRVKPEQKRDLVLALRYRGYNVAMTGDGINDIPAMKAADCSVAMAGGTDAARHAAQITLLESDFSVMPDIVLEGRRVINNITRTATLFLTKTIFSFLLSVLVLFTPGNYPFQPIQLTLISSLTIGLPGFFLAMEPSRERITGGFLQTILKRALPGGAAAAVCAVLAASLEAFGWNHTVCSTVATMTVGMICYLVLVRNCLPLNGKRAALLAGIAAAAGAAVGTMPGLFFLERMNGTAWSAWAVLSALGAGILFGTDWLMKQPFAGRLARRCFSGKKNPVK